MQTSSKSLIKTKKFLLDTSAIIALLKQESGYKILEDVITRIRDKNLSILIPNSVKLLKQSDLRRLCI
ncbi:MAG: hypothetical protein ACEY3E_07200 [Candidatus Tisiphia sp.]